MKTFLASTLLVYSIVFYLAIFYVALKMPSFFENVDSIAKSLRHNLVCDK